MRLKTIYIIFFILCFTSCDRAIHRLPEFVRAEALMDNRPDSARALLFGLKKQMGAENRATRMYYDLLLTKANDKCYVLHTSDSTMLEVVKYYEHHDKSIRKMEAYYLLGRVYSDMQYTGEAINSFRKALNVKGGNDAYFYIISARANNQIGHIYMYQDMCKEAFPFFLESYRFAKLAKDTTITIYALRDIGRSYQAQEILEKGIDYYVRAAALAQKMEQPYLYKMIMSELSGLYRRNKEYGKAKNALLAAYGFTDKQDLIPYYMSWAKYYQCIGQMDSAVHFLKKCIGPVNLYTAQEATNILAHIYNRENKPDKACYYALKYSDYTDSLNREEIVKNQNLIDILNHKLQVESENNLLQQKSLMQRFVFVIIFGLLILMIIIIYHYAHNRKIRYKEQEERLNRSLFVLRQNSKQTIDENSEKINELETQLSSSKQKNGELQNQLIQAEKKWLEKKNSQIEAEQEKQEILQKRLEQSDIFLQFHQMAENGHRASDEEFKQLEKLIDETYNNFTHRLYELYPSINFKERRVCELIKIGLTPTEMSCILCSSNSGISMIRQRLCQKMFHIKGKPEVLDRLINDI